MTDSIPTEPCVLGGEIVDIPRQKLIQERSFRTVFSDHTWKEVLTEDERRHLRKMLPAGTDAEQDSTVHKLFTLQNIKFGNPLKQFHKSLKRNHYNPDNWYFRQLKKKALRKTYKDRMIQRKTDMLEDLILLREEYITACQNLTEAEITEKLDSNWRRETLHSIKQPKRFTPANKANKLYHKLMSDVRRECDDSSSSSDDEYGDKSEHQSVPDERVGDLLKNHIKRRLAKEIAPTLDTRNTLFNDIMDRVYHNKPDDEEMTVPHSAAKKLKLSKVPTTPAVTSEKKKKTTTAVKNEPQPVIITSQPPAAVEQPAEASPICKLPPASQNPLHVIKTILLENNNDLSELEIVNKLNDWQQTEAARYSSWSNSIYDWSNYIFEILSFLAETSVVIETVSGRWNWFTSSDKDSDEQLISIWKQMLDLLPALCAELSEDVEEDDERATADDGEPFETQEARRFAHPHKSFVYKIDGSEIVVPPVKGVYDRLAAQTSTNKAREHALLVNDRPSYVTLLTLVRDAAARLPGGEGTRYDICDLLKESQFISPTAEDNHINTVVSGALDRLHYEKDPCVRYDSGRKVWMYLHADRSAAQLERIHEAQGAALKAKKASKPSKSAVSSQQSTGGRESRKTETPPVKVEPSEAEQSAESNMAAAVLESTGSQSLLSSSFTSVDKETGSLVSLAHVSTAPSNLTVSNQLKSMSRSQSQDLESGKALKSEPPLARQLSLSSAQIAGLTPINPSHLEPANHNQKLALISNQKPLSAMSSLISQSKQADISAGQSSVLQSSQVKGTVYYQKINSGQGMPNVLQKVQAASPARSSAQNTGLVHRIVGSPTGAPVLARLIQTHQGQAKSQPANQQFTQIQLQGNRQIALGTNTSGRPIQILTAPVQNQTRKSDQSLKQHEGAHGGASPVSTPGRIVNLQQHLVSAAKSQPQATSLLTPSPTHGMEGKQTQQNVQLVKAMLSEGKSGGHYILTTTPQTQQASSLLTTAHMMKSKDSQTTSTVLAHVVSSHASVAPSRSTGGGRSILTSQGLLRQTSAGPSYTQMSSMAAALKQQQLMGTISQIRQSELPPNQSVDIEDDLDL